MFGTYETVTQHCKRKAYNEEKSGYNNERSSKTSTREGRKDD